MSSPNLPPRLLRWLALGGWLGPLAFIGAWLVGAGLREDGYSFLIHPISRLAAHEATTQPLMTAGFIAFGLAVPAYALSLRQAVRSSAWIAAAGTGFATLAVAAFPLGVSASVDQAHNAAAGIGYATLAATPLLSFTSLRHTGERALAFAGLAAGLVSIACLALSVHVDHTGLFQRVGLTVTDLWIMASVVVVRRRLATETDE